MSGTTWQQEMMSAYEPSLKFLLRRLCCRDKEYALKKNPHIFISNKPVVINGMPLCSWNSDFLETLKRRKLSYHSGFHVPGSLAIGVIPGFDNISVPHNIVGEIRW